MPDAQDRVSLVICLVPGFNAFTTLAFVDPFRVANYFRRDKRYSWVFASETGARIEASIGVDFQTTAIADVKGDPDFAILSSGWIPPHIDMMHTTHALRRWDRRGTTIGGLSSGAYLLATMGLLDGAKSTVHYETQPAFHETFPDLEITGDTYVIDGRRVASCGGTISLDLALECINQLEKPSLVQSIGKYIFHPNRRPLHTPQDPIDLEPLLLNSPKPMVDAIAHIGNSPDAGIKIAAVCHALGLSPARLRELSNAQTGLSPVKIRDKIRFGKARTLVLQTGLSITEIAVISGYNDLSAFSRAYKSAIGLAPSIDRRQWGQN